MDLEASLGVQVELFREELCAWVGPDGDEKADHLEVLGLLGDHVAARDAGEWPLALPDAGPEPNRRVRLAELEAEPKAGRVAVPRDPRQHVAS